MEKIKLKDVVTYTRERIEFQSLKLETYISTENLLQNKQGVTQAKQLPTTVLNTAKYNEGNILISNIRPYLKKIYYSNQTGGVSSDVLTFVCKDQYYSKYIYYNLFQDTFFSHMMNGSKGTKMPRGDKQQILEFEIPDLPYNDQQKIARVLSSLDDKIQNNNRINRELETMAKLLYDYWFLQFDFPDENGKPFKSSGGAMVYNEKLKKEIPRGWNSIKIKGLIKDITTGLNPRNHFTLGDGNNYYVTIKNIKYGRIVFDETCDKISDEALARVQKRSNLKKGDVLFTSIEPVGVTYLLTEDPINWNINESVFNITPNTNVTTSEYLLMLLSSEELRKQCSNASTGSIHKGIRITPLKEFTVINPNFDIITKFTNTISNYLSLIDVNQKQNQKLETLRDWLLPMLMNGQVTVADAEDKIEEAMGMVGEEPSGYVKEIKLPKTSPQLQTIILTPQDKKIHRKMLAAFIVNQSLEDNSFGKTKFEKLLHLIEYHVLKHDYSQKYSVQAAGPYDGGFTKTFWAEVTKSGWFDIQEYGTLKRIIPGVNNSKSRKDYGYFSEEEKMKVSNFIKMFEGDNYERPEMISTLYAVWNNRIIRRELITDELLKKDFLAWDSQKKKYSSRLDKALEWMREKEIIPDGWGNIIERAKKHIKQSM